MQHNSLTSYPPSNRLLYLINLFFLLAIPSSILCQNTGYQVTAIRIQLPAKVEIDGDLTETAWLSAIPATGFTVYEPEFGKKPLNETEAFFLYDDYGLYIGLKMHDSSPDSIVRDLSVRDDEGNSDWVSLLISPSNDGQNGFMFEVTAAGVQIDSKIISDGAGDDLSWDAVWYSKTSMKPDGWIAEILIPWSAIRFPNLGEQTWDINVMREVRRYREQSTWHPVDRRKHGFLTQSGKITGLNGLHTPIRLALMPYGSGYLQKLSNEKHTSYTFNAGLDLKYGILNNFTLDATLIPDFGQVRSDDEIYNFSPHEVKYNENRPFFTEGTELFNKAGIFYSRRIGQRPAGYNGVSGVLAEGDSVLTNPLETQLINATKFSGRTRGGFAIGLFNAMTKASFATICDSNDFVREYLTQPFTNYTMVVLDQSVANNAFIHLANTNVARNGYGANVTATSIQLKNRKQSYAVSGNGAFSQHFISDQESDPGYRYGLSVSRISGDFRWTFGHSAISQAYNPNDMGYQTVTNTSDITGTIGYYQFRPVRNMLNYNIVASGSYNMLHQDYHFTYAQLNLRANTTYRNRLSLGGSFEVVPTELHDYYEARIPGRVFIQPGYSFLRVWFSPDYRKKFLVDLNGAAWKSHDTIQRGYSLSVSPRLRLNQRSLMILGVTLEQELPSIGYVDQVSISDSTILLFGERRINTLTTTLTAQYILSPLSSFSLRVRHYWVTTEYNQFYALPEDGYVAPTLYTGEHDFTLNIFNIDLGYAWNFAPGSYLNIVYKNALFQNGEGKAEYHYGRNWQNILETPATNSISVKLIYYIDYESIRRNFKHKAV